MMREITIDDYKDTYSYPGSRNKERTSKMPKVCPYHGNQQSGDASSNGSNQDSDDESELTSTATLKGSFDHDCGQHINNASVMLQKFASLFKSELLSDIEIVIGYKTYRSHKLILCSSSDVFRVMLTNPSWPESRSHRLVLQEEPECIHVFDDFLRYMYTGCVHLTHYTVLPMLMLADKYNVCDLRDVCTDYMASHLVSTLQHNHAVSWLQYANNCAHFDLATTCFHFILLNFHKVLCTNDFLLLERDILLEIIKHEDVVVPDEYTLFKGISRWMQHQRLQLNGQLEFDPDLYNSGLEILCQIRFPMMTPEQLSQLEQDPLAKYFSTYFLEKVVVAMNYHAVARNDTLSSQEMTWSPRHYEPRHYTNDVWSTSLSIDNFASLPPHDVRPLIFSSPISGAQVDENQCWEWNVDLFPKGIHFQKCILIGLWRNLEICGAMYNTVRLVLRTNNAEVRTVDVTVLVKGIQDNVEHVKTMVKKRCMFDLEKTMSHIDDIVPFDELNCVESDYLTGGETEAFKIVIIIKPV